MRSRPLTFKLFPYTTLFRSHLHVLDDRIFGALADLELHDRGIEALIGDHGEQVLLVEDQRLGVLVSAVQDGGHLAAVTRSEEHTSELQSHSDLVCRLLLEKQ